MKNALLAPAILAFFVPPLHAQPTGDAREGEYLSISHSESGNPETPHRYQIDFTGRTGRLYVIEETEDLILARWRRLPLLLAGNESLHDWQNAESKPIPYVYSYTDSAGQAMFQPLATEPNPLQFDASGDRQFVRLRYVDGPLDPIHGGP